MELTKTEDYNTAKESFWTDDLVAEFARELYETRQASEVWTDTHEAEKGCIKTFIKRKKFEKVYGGVVTNDPDNGMLLVHKDKFNECINFLFNYRDDD